VDSKQFASTEQINIKFICVCSYFYVGQKDRLLPNFCRTFTISVGKSDRTNKFRKHWNWWVDFITDILKQSTSLSLYSFAIRIVLSQGIVTCICINIFSLLCYTAMYSVTSIQDCRQNYVSNAFSFDGNYSLYWYSHHPKMKCVMYMWTMHLNHGTCTVFYFDDWDFRQKRKWK
jgi:hypothetical protein